MGAEAYLPASSSAGTLKAAKKKWNVPAWTKGFLLPAVIVAVWQVIGSLGLISPTVLPVPSAILSSFWELTVSGDLLANLRISVLRAVLGFLLGGSLGLLFGILVGFSRKTESYLDPSLQMLRTIPNLAVTPLFILWFGFDELSKVLLISFGSFFPIYINTYLGIRSADSRLFDVARVLEFSRKQQITKLVLPSALSNILLGVRLSLGIAWLSLVVAELMGSSAGIGYLIMDARQFSQTDKVFVGIIIFAVVGKLTDSLVRLLERRLLKWRNSFEG
ncbi:ABC transporter permease [Aciduricibacillus chroicocephali]|uniref:ABC transporter permease n=1 Tax=Aciduricibacillus chroicocephali TaxID=3054939 RepID=A0ABY9KSX9_9BACI|nr:ABC transporter permease [Bacillaceae bacterium 44XB]